MQTKLTVLGCVVAMLGSTQGQAQAQAQTQTLAVDVRVEDIVAVKTTDESLAFNSADETYVLSYTAGPAGSARELSPRSAVSEDYFKIHPRDSLQKTRWLDKEGFPQDEPQPWRGVLQPGEAAAVLITFVERDSKTLPYVTALAKFVMKVVPVVTAVLAATKHARETGKASDDAKTVLDRALDGLRAVVAALPANKNTQEIGAIIALVYNDEGTPIVKWAAQDQVSAFPAPPDGSEALRQTFTATGGGAHYTITVKVAAVPGTTVPPPTRTFLGRKQLDCPGSTYRFGTRTLARADEAELAIRPEGGKLVWYCGSAKHALAVPAGMTAARIWYAKEKSGFQAGWRTGWTRTVGLYHDGE